MEKLIFCAVSEAWESPNIYSIIKVQLLGLALLKSDIAYPFFTGPIGFEENISNTLVLFLILI